MHYRPTLSVAPELYGSLGKRPRGSTCVNLLVEKAVLRAWTYDLQMFLCAYMCNTDVRTQAMRWRHNLSIFSDRSLTAEDRLQTKCSTIDDIMRNRDENRLGDAAIWMHNRLRQKCMQLLTLFEHCSDTEPKIVFHGGNLSPCCFEACTIKRYVAEQWVGKDKNLFLVNLSAVSFLDVNSIGTSHYQEESEVLLPCFLSYRPICSWRLQSSSIRYTVVAAEQRHDVVYIKDNFDELLKAYREESRTSMQETLQPPTSEILDNMPISIEQVYELLFILPTDVLRVSILAKHNIHTPCIIVLENRWTTVPMRKSTTGFLEDTAQYMYKKGELATLKDVIQSLTEYLYRLPKDKKFVGSKYSMSKNDNNDLQLTKLRNERLFEIYPSKTTTRSIDDQRRFEDFASIALLSDGTLAASIKSWTSSILSEDE